MNWAGSSAEPALLDEPNLKLTANELKEKYPVVEDFVGTKKKRELQALRSKPSYHIF